MLRRRPASSSGTESPDDVAAVQALDQVANWVRFADTKATVLTAGFGVVLSALVANWKIVSTTISLGTVGACGLEAVVGAGLAAGLVTLYCLVRAIVPRSTGSDRGLNRFAWPSLARTSAAEIAEHARRVPAADDAWRQAVELAAIASRKFRYTSVAVWSFAAFVILGFATVAIAASVGG